MGYAKWMNLYFDLYYTLRHRFIKRYWIKVYQNRINNTVPFTKEQENMVTDFFAPYAKVSPVFHRVYYENTGHFSEKHLPIDLYFNVVDEYFNDIYEAKYLDNKCYYKKMFPGIRQPDYAVAKMGRFWFDENDQLISYDKVKEIVSRESELFLKAATESNGGKGVSYISADQGDMVKQFEEFTCQGDWIAQRPIRQHEAISAVNESSVNTIRIVTLLCEDEVKVYSAIMRIGKKGSKCDNASSGGITIGITEDGKLKKYAHEYSGQRYDRHPSNDFVFEGYQVPSFDKAIELVKKAHPMVPHFRLVSWDVCIAEDGEAVLMETNLCKGGIDIHEFNNGPLFGEDTKKILDEVFGK
ncbi:MAG: hypothetical protein E7402_00240 [Ruminococcaceae bacterium]|nr:hypothetical protein [Oscillospiraceae bacterium]